MKDDIQDIKQELQSGPDEEFGYNGEEGSINAIAQGELHVEISHFVVRRKDRRNGIGTVIFNALIDVLKENGYHSATIRIQAVEDGSKSDPVMKFFKQYNFQYQKRFEHHNWGTCIELTGYF